MARILIADASEAEVAILTTMVEALGHSVAPLLDRRGAENVSGLARLMAIDAELQGLVAVAAHDLRSPLGRIAQAARFVVKDLSATLEPETGELLDMIINNAGELTRLVDELQQYASDWPAENSEQTVDLGVVMTRVGANLAVRIDETRAEIAVERLPTILGPEGWLVDLFQHLVANALLFTRADPPRVTVNATRENEYWHLAVQDNGIGIAPAYHEEIFAPLRRLHPRRRYEGTGLGLATCKKIVEALGGHIWVESEEGRGSVFHVLLPDTTTHPEHTTTPSSVHAQPGAS